MRTFLDAKAMAKAMRETLATKGLGISHSEALEIVARLRCEGTALLSERAGRPPASLRRESGDVFFEPGRPRSRRIFRRDGSGAVTGFVDRRDGHDLAWERIP